jgi:hypothetical protein
MPRLLYVIKDIVIYKKVLKIATLGIHRGEWLRLRTRPPATGTNHVKGAPRKGSSAFLFAQECRAPVLALNRLNTLVLQTAAAWQAILSP